jgi:hypothetical protein
MNSFYVSIQGQSYGPADAEELRKWHLAGSFNESDFVWNEAKNEWVAAASVAELAEVFRVEKTPGIGVDDAEELPRAERTEPTEPEKRPQEELCVNHDTVTASAICPKCRKHYCADCLVEIEGLSICNNCVGSEKGEATRSWKRSALIVGAVVLFIGAMIGSYLFLGPTPVEQTPEPVRQDIELGDRPPPFVSEDLKPAERAKVEADLQALVAARLAAAGTVHPEDDDTGAGESSTMPLDGDDWIAALVAAGHLAETPKPPREGLAYRPADEPPAVEVWTLGQNSRCFMVAREDTIVLIPRQ